MRGRRERGGVPNVMQWMRLKPAKVSDMILLAAGRVDGKKKGVFTAC